MPDRDTQHTPTPWRYQQEIETRPSMTTPRLPDIVRFEIYRDGPGGYGHPATCEKEADADLIVLAVNAHADLLAALESAPVEPPLGMSEIGYSRWMNDYVSWRTQIRAAALAKVKA